MLNNVFSQENNVVIWKYADEISFTADIPQGWTAVENLNPAKGALYFFWLNESIITRPIIFITVYWLSDSTDEALCEIINRNINSGQYTYEKIDNLNEIERNVIFYNTNYQNYSFSRCAYIRHDRYGFQIDLSTLYEKPEVNLINTLNELINSIVFINK